MVRETVPLNALRAFFDRAFGAVMGVVQEQHAELAGPPFALYRGTPTDVVDVEAGFPLAAPVIGGTDATVIAGVLPAGPAYEALHAGPYRSLQQTYAAILARMRKDGVSPAEAMSGGCLPQRPRRQAGPGKMADLGGLAGCLSWRSDCPLPAGLARRGRLIVSDWPHYSSTPCVMS